MIDLGLPTELQKDFKLTTKEIKVAAVFTTKNKGRFVVTPLCLEAHFNACHKLHHPNWTEQKSHEVFGTYNNANYHGHTYRNFLKNEKPFVTAIILFRFV
jgi:hypothetical protein